MAVDIGILVVDDEPALCKTIAAILCNAGYRATPCGDPDLALTLLQDWSFALLITDHSMPGMSGLKLIERARLSSPSLKFIVLSGSLSGNDAAAYQNAGVLATLAKPFDRMGLLDVIAQAVAECG